MRAIFPSIAAVSVVAAASALLTRGDELDIGSAADLPARNGHVPLSTRFADRRVILLFVATPLFHLANASVMPLVRSTSSTSTAVDFVLTLDLGPDLTLTYEANEQ